MNTQEQGSETEAHFQIDEFDLKPKITLTKDIIMEGTLLFQPQSGQSRVSKMYVNFSVLPLNSFLKVGLDEPFFTIRRKTEGYPLLGTAFWRSRETGILWGGEHKSFYWRTACSSGQKLDRKEVGKDISYKMIYDFRRDSNYPGLGYAVGLGIKPKIGKGNLDLLGFYCNSKLSPDDIKNLKTYLAGSGYISADNDKNRYGINLDYKLRDFSLLGQWLKSEDGDFNRNGWFIQPSYKLKSAQKRFNAFEFLFRWGELNADIKKTAKSETWDRKEQIFGLITELNENIKIKTEYSIYGEETGDGEVDNDELVVQMMVEF